jgi:DHA1 family tetracycline resistance protein-like MFS transporter
MTPPPGSHRALAFILLTVFIDVVGLGIIIPVFPQLLLELTGEPLNEAAAIGGWIAALYAALMFLSAPVIGNLSDRFGRRPVLLVSLFALGVDYLVMGFAPTIFWLFLSRALSGVCGASYTTAGAYIADVTSPEQRAKSFGLFGAAWSAGFVLGPVIGGLVGTWGPRMPFFVAAGLALTNVAFGYFVLPESLKRENRRAFEWKRANPLGALLQMRRYPVVFGLLGAMCLYHIAHNAYPAVWSFLAIEKFNWDPQHIGFSLGFIGVAYGISMATLVGPVVKRFGEERSVYFGMLLYAFGYFGIAVATSGWMIYAVVAISALGAAASPALQSILTKHIPPNSQGELQGALTSVASLMSIGAPLIMTQLFSTFSVHGSAHYFPGAPFMLAAVLTVGSAVICGSVLRAARHHRAAEATSTPSG